MTDPSFKCKKRNSVTFQDVWWVRISITTHYNSIHVIINWFRLTGGHQGNTLKTHRSHHSGICRHASLGAAAPGFCVN